MQAEGREASERRGFLSGEPFSSGRHPLRCAWRARKLLCSLVTPPVQSARPGWNDENTREDGLGKSVAGGWKWWQWPHLLSLDAPLVAVSWLWWWSSNRHIHLPANRFAILALAVWGVYVADHLADVTGTRSPGPSTDRHHFSAVYGPWLFRALGVVLPTLAATTVLGLPVRQLLGGLALLGLVAFYYWAVHHAPRTIRPWLPKEAVVGGMFASGTVFFLLGECSAEGWLGLEAGLFGGLCFLNCGLITVWEQSPQDLEDPGSLLRAFPRTAGSPARRGPCRSP